MSQRVLFSRFLEGFIFGPSIYECWQRSTAKNYCPISLLSVIRKVFEKLVSNRIFDHLEKCVLFSDSHYGFRSSRSTADLLTVVTDRIARAFKKSGATWAVALDISKAFDTVQHVGLLHKLKSYGISGQILGLIFYFLSNRGFRWFWMGNLHKNSHFMLEFLQGPLLVLHFSSYTLVTFLMMLSVILLSMLMILLSTLNVTRHMIFGENLNWAELKSDLKDTVVWAGSGLLISMLEKPN